MSFLSKGLSSKRASAGVLRLKMLAWRKGLLRGESCRNFDGVTSSCSWGRTRNWLAFRGDCRLKGVACNSSYFCGLFRQVEADWV